MAVHVAYIDPLGYHVKVPCTHCLCCTGVHVMVTGSQRGVNSIKRYRTYKSPARIVCVAQGYM